jgi:hypothetical protein
MELVFGIKTRVELTFTSRHVDSNQLRAVK